MAVTQLRLVSPSDWTPPDDWIVCVQCGAVDSDGVSGPGYLTGGDGSYRRRVDWHCAPCGRRAWSAYYSAVRLRMAIIRESAIAGYPLTTSQYMRRMKHRTVQMRLI